MIPLKDENRSKTIPVVNIILIFTNLAFFMYQQLFAFQEVQTLFLRLGAIPYEFTHFVDKDPPALVPVPLTLLTAMFMHGGWIHLLSNMLFLWIFGDNVEDRLGHFRYLCFYLLCGVAGSLSHIATNSHSTVPSIGASGAIAGVMGAYMWLFPRARITTLLILFVVVQVIRVPAIIMLGYWILIQILGGLAGWGSRGGAGIAWFAHVGGFFAGLLLVIKMKKGRRKS
ncbi:MAG: rhomboid family intramembrane serine protease [Desulfobacteraceae bacterium]